MFRFAGADTAGFRTHDDTVGENFQMVGFQRRTRGGDINDDIRLPRRRRAFGGTEAFDDAVKLDAVLA